VTSGLEARELPDGRIELTLGKCVPVVVSLETYARHTRAELFRLVALLTLVAHYFSKEHGYLLPLRTGRFAEGPEAERLVLAAEGPQGAFCNLSVPRGCAFGEGLL
jgi:hypothetical protein